MSDSDSDDYNPELLLPKPNLATKLPNTQPASTPPSPSSPPPPPPSHLPSKPIKSVKFADNTIQIPSNPNYSSSSPSNSPPSLPTANLDPLSIDYDNLNISLFNEIVKFFISSNLINDEEFNKLSPCEKTSKLIQNYEQSIGKSINTDNLNLNFNATTSYNKSILKPNDKLQLLVPINPYCRRPDLNTSLTNTELSNFEKFKVDSEKYSKEFECLNFPSGSRLFIGNLAVNSLKILDIWRIFSKYGEIKSINMKQGYGFVQFKNATDCKNSIIGENHVPLHNKLMELQVSKTHEKHTSQKIKSKIQIIISIDSTNEFNHLLVNSINELGNFDCLIKHIDTTTDDLSQDLITESAYNGNVATIVTSKFDLVNLFLFQKNPNDNSIKFDEYENISLESAINFIKNHNYGKERDAKDKQRKRPRERERDTRNTKHHGNTSSSNYKTYNNHNNNHNNHNNNSNNNSSNSSNNTIRYSPRQQDQQKHLPPQVSHPSYNLPQQTYYQSPASSSSQMYNTSQQSYNSPISSLPTQQSYSVPPNSNMASQLLNQLSTLDEGSLKAMLNMVNHQQSTTQLPSQPPLPPAPPTSSSGEDDVSQLFETLARLKNNM